MDSSRLLPVYLVHYNAPDWLRSACASILASEDEVELVVVNNSTDVPSIDASVRVINSGGNLGFTGGANLALHDWLSGPSEFCVVGSHDLHVDGDTFTLMRQTLEGNPDVGIAGPQLAHGAVMPEPSEGIDDVSWVSGTCMMLRRACIQEIGLFDERYRSYAEDFDLCHRATKSGWRVVQVHAAVAHGLGTATGGQASRRLANSVLFDSKHYGRLGGHKTFGRLMLGIPQALMRRQPRAAAARLAAIPLAVRHLVAFRSEADQPKDSLRIQRTRASSHEARGLEVLVVAYGAPEMLRNALEPVHELPITVVDNSSLPEIKDLCTELGCRYIDPGFNGGFAAGVNVGLAHRQVPAGDVLLLNPDAEISVDVVRQLQNALLMDDKLASVGPRQVDEAGNPIRVSWPFLSPLGVWLDAVGLTKLRPTAQYVSGAILLLRAEAIDQVGAFDDAFFLYAEEEDWAYRADKLGWRHVVVPDATAMHVGGGTSSNEPKRQTHFHASQERFLRKHYGAVGWQIARAGQVFGDATRSVMRRGDTGRALRARAVLYLRGPLSVEAAKYPPPIAVPAWKGQEGDRTPS